MACDDHKHINEVMGSKVQEFFKNQNVLVTGATGFLGKVLLEKMLRCCPNLEKVYVIVRKKYNKDVKTRLNEIFDDPLFDCLKLRTPNFRDKVIAVTGDCGSVGLGLTLKDRKILVEKINIIYNSAATVKFTEHIRTALAINVGGPIHLLELAKEMKNLKVFAHISTAYCMPYLDYMEEKLYPLDVEYDYLMKTMEKLDDVQLNNVLPQILSKWPNTYTFTKALGESELAKRAGTIPICFIRPAIVTSTVKEPLKYWTESNFNGPVRLTISCMTGVLRTFLCDGSATAQIVPVDSTANCILVASAKVAEDYEKRTQKKKIQVYNYGSNKENRLTWNEFISDILNTAERAPFPNAIWYHFVLITKFKILYNIYKIFLHYIPALVVDVFLVLSSQKPKLLKMTMKVENCAEIVDYFLSREFNICNRETEKLWDDTNNIDKLLFPFSLRDVDWREYLKNYSLGIRRYYFKQSDNSLPEARRTFKRLYYLHQAAKLFLCCFVFCFLLF